MLDIHIKYYYVLLFTYELHACVQQYNGKAKFLYLGPMWQKFRDEPHPQQIP